MKKIKDPIYGYIEIKKDLFNQVIDTDCFQRLRDIVQTSYRPLYATATHNRFVHSLGVYFLGTLVAKAIETCPPEDLQVNYKRYLTVFQYACLLHDVGHAPFSHTGEGFYLPPDSIRDKFHIDISTLIKEESFLEDIKARNYKAAAHELMSVVVALKRFKFLFKNNKERAFFARAILGYYYNNPNNDQQWENCLMSLLHSSLIDVDRLDYIIRDAYFTGYDTVKIDYKRLLSSIIIKKHGSDYSVVYKKSALSVIEDVIYAHDSEKKWIQNHPMILYESVYLLKHAFEKIQNKYDIFNYEALTKVGKKINKNITISLMSDSDIVFLMKNIGDSVIDEYFDRTQRKHPLWKSESEFKAAFNDILTETTRLALEKAFDDLLKNINITTGVNLINNDAQEKLQADLDEYIKKVEEETNPNTIDNLQTSIKYKKKRLELIKVFKDFADLEGLDFEFIILSTKQFESNFSKTDLGRLLIDFDAINKQEEFAKVSHMLSSLSEEEKNFFYIYCKKNRDIDYSPLASNLAQYAISYLGLAQ